MDRRTFIYGSAGTALAWSSGSGAQQKSALPVIGYLSGGSAGYYAPYLDEFRKGLQETGYVEGQNLTIEYRWAEGRYDRLSGFAAYLVSRKVDVIVASGGDLASRAAKTATSTIPIVFTSGGDPVADGRVASLARPGGNLTGVTLLAVGLDPKRIELLTELVPKARVIALLVNPDNANAEGVIRDIVELAREKRVHLHVLKAGTESEIDTAFESLVQLRAGALLVSPDAFIHSRREQIVALAARHSIPAIYAWREFAGSGGLISYGASIAAVYRQLGIYTGKILRGTKPSELPIEQPTKFELVINAKTAKALGLTIPQMLLQRADEVIR